MGGGSGVKPNSPQKCLIIFVFDFFSLQLILQRGSNCLIERKLKFSRGGGPILFPRGVGHIAIFLYIEAYNT